MNRKTNQTLVGTALVASLLFAGSAARTLAAQAVVGSARNVTINVVNSDIVDVLKALATQTGSNIVAGPETKDKMVTISMKDAELTAALDMVTKLNGLGYKLVNGTYVVASPDHLKTMYPTSATTVVYTLTSMKPSDAAGALTKLVPGVMAQPNGLSMITLTGDTEDVSAAKTMLAQMEGSSAAVTGERTTEVYQLKYLNPMEAMRTVASVIPDVLITVAPGKSLPGSGKVGSGANGTTETTTATTAGATPTGVSAPGEVAQSTSVQLNPGEMPTALLITGYPASIARAMDLLNKVDTAPRQVEITARVVDLSANDAAKLGLSYTFGNLDLAEGDNSNDPTGTEPRAKPLKFGQFFRVPFDVGIKLDALATRGNSKILANPSIAAIDNRPARIFIGDTITYVVSQSVAPSTGQVTVATEKAHIGITLLVTPRVSGDGTITLEVHPNVSALTGLTDIGGTALPQISERSVDTTIRVKDGETVAIGGLLREDEIKSVSRVPLLGDIPFFGELFKHRNTTKTRSDVTIFITTKVAAE